MKIRYPGPDDSFHRVHTYFKGCPWEPSGRRILLTRFAGLGGKAAVCLLDPETGRETVLGESDFFGYHSGSRACFCAGGARVIYQVSADRVACLDLDGGGTVSFPGSICVYSGDLDRHFIEIDENFPPGEQARMGIYRRGIDGRGKKCLAALDRLLDAHPEGEHMRESGILFRLGGEISPDRRKIILFLVGRFDTKVRDYFTCDPDGADLVFHGRLGCHIIWHPDSRRILSWANRRGSFLPGALLPEGHPDMEHSFLGVYDTETRRAELAGVCREPGSWHVAPSPDGRLVVADRITREEIGILLFDFRTGEIREIHREQRCLEVEEKDEAVLDQPHGAKRYDVNPHPVFSRDGRKILFNSCTDGRVRPREIEL